jgi:hypothetical protein
MANTTADLLLNLAQSTFSKTETNPVSCTFYVQIVNKIKTIPVTMHIEIRKIKDTNNEYKFYGNVHIKSSKIFYNSSLDYIDLYSNEYKLDKLSLKAINTFLHKVKSDLEKIKFDKFLGRFVLHNGNINIDNIGIDIFGDKYSNAAECCVCYEKTYTETICSHYLCVECWSNIKKKTCPMCREYLSAKENTDSSDDEN